MRPQDEVEFAELVAGMSSRLNRLAYAVCGDRQAGQKWTSVRRSAPSGSTADR